MSFSSTNPSGYHRSDAMEPDLMNDHDFSHEQKPDEVCRICRGEGSSDEPLFYPCKCSGSIKFVHQECLMEWLSHSQKKYCELCKTPFRFTKLYHPQMPRHLPAAVFCRRAFMHILSYLLTWCRAVLVGFVWLICLPLAMRMVWRWLFWVGDAGWARDVHIRKISSSSRPSEGVTSVDLASMVSSISSAFEENSTAAAQALPRILSSFANITAPESSAFKMLRTLFHKFNIGPYSSIPAAALNSTNATNTANIAMLQHSSLLSEVAFFSSFSSSPFVNRIVLDIFEGQIITILVVAAFILIFLIREWVVQQQPVQAMLGRVDQNPPERVRDADAQVDLDAHDHAGEQDNDNHLQRRFEREERDDDDDHDDDNESAMLNAEFQDPNLRRGRGRHPENGHMNHRANHARIRPRPEVGLLDAIDADNQVVHQSDEDSEGENEIAGVRYHASPSRHGINGSAGREPHNVDEWNGSARMSQRHSSSGNFDDGSRGRRWSRSNGSRENHEVGTEGHSSTLEEMRHRIMLNIDETIPAESRDRFITERVDEMLANPRNAPDEEINSLSQSLNDLQRDPTGAADVFRRRSPRIQALANSSASITPSEHLTTSPLADITYSSSAPAEGFSTGSSAQLRPHMPSRERSSMATEIRRGIEERDRRISDQQIQYAAKRRDENQFDEPSSEESSGSWQHVSDINGNGTARPSPASRKSSARNISAPQIHQGISNYDRGRLVRDEMPRSSPIRSEFSSSDGDDDDESSSSDHHRLSFQSEPLLRVPSENSSLVEREERAIPDDHVNVSQTAQVQDATDIPQAREPVDHPQGFLHRVLDWFWDDVAPAEAENAAEGADDEHILRDLAAEEPFIPFAAAEAVNANEPADDQNQDPEVAAAAAEAGIDLNDPDAVDDAEDLEGILELIGMQGPLTGLFQNAIFSSVLIAATLVGAIGIPYVFGKLVLFVIGNPISVCIKLPLQVLSSFADLVVDMTVALCSSLIYALLHGTQAVLQSLSLALPKTEWLMNSLESAASNFLEPIYNSWDRICENFSRLDAIGDFLWFSASSHAALRMIQQRFSEGLEKFGESVSCCLNSFLDESSITSIPPQIYKFLITLVSFEIKFWTRAYEIGLAAWNARTLKISMDFAHITQSNDAALQYWNAKDRVIATFAGYGLFAVAGMIYQKSLFPITSSEQGRKIESIISEVLQQTGGVFKVILIISIEMIAFPLYCGILLDIAMLPLFAGATFRTRLAFATSSPWTAGFVHWFVGTCYMFHFALFVSMCRKIMRRGVLYFIRDPDDPTFHPVRDVLERNVTTQLRKITFSAMVYGGLIIICLGGVVWALDCGFKSILPIHWSTNQPALEFPLDLLFYNFLTPLVIRVLKPSDALHSMYTWWFQTCARLLRLSDFLFGTRPLNEQGRHIRRTWSAWLRREKGDVEKPVTSFNQGNPANDREVNTYFLFDGRFVRAPASDQVRIPKGENVFIDVDEHNNRLDKLSEDSSGVHAKNSPLTAMIYIPPNFRLRIATFIFTLWLFAAATGVGVTIVPLLLGRKAFSLLAPDGWIVNDIYAFSFGAYALAGLAYLFAHLRSTYSFVRASSPQVYFSTFSTAVNTVCSYTLRILGLIYVYTFLVLVLPLFFAVLLELYILIPLHTYLGPQDTHVVHVVQDWTLGFLYARIGYRVFFADRTSRPSRALRAVIRDGLLKPNAWLATRCFIAPLTLAFVAALLAPLVAHVILQSFLLPRLVPSSLTPDDEFNKLMFRYTYPVVLAAGLAFYTTRETGKAVNRWRRVIKDEVYLIGERLHNFNESRPGPMTGALGKVVAEAGGAVRR